jgi:hypothetical protein
VEVPTANGEVLWMMPDVVGRLAAFDPRAEEQIQLLAGADSLVLRRRNSADLFAEPDLDRKVLNSTWHCRLTFRTIPSWTAAGSWGLGSTIPQNRESHWLFAGTTPAVTRRIAEVEAWIRDELGDFRSFSLDSPASRRDRIDALNAAGTA